MSAQVKRKSFTFTWILENVSYCWQKKDESISSPAFVISALQDTKYCVYFHPRGCNKDNYIGFELRSIGNVSSARIDCELALLSKDGSVLTSIKMEKCVGGVFLPITVKIKELFVSNRSAYLPDDKLTARCRIWKSDGEMAEDAQYFGSTRICIERAVFLWNIRNFDSLQPGEQRIHHVKSVLNNEVLMTFDLFVKNPYTDEDSISIQLESKNGKIKYFELYLIPLIGLESVNIGIRKEIFFYGNEKLKLLALPFSKKDIMENKHMCLPNDVLSFHCECTFPTGTIFGEIESVIYGGEGLAPRKPNSHGLDEKYAMSESKRILNENLKSMFQDNILSDVKLKTSTKTFLAHKSILISRSPVFKAMFENDMKEKWTECVDIEDLDADTVCEMLHYIYTAEIKDLQWKKACDLYRAADKYEILALRDECSAYLKSNLCPNNACEVLILADTHQNVDLNISVQDYICEHDIINSEGWKQLMETHLKLAADTMYLQIQIKRINDKLISSVPEYGTNTVDMPSASPALHFPQPKSLIDFPGCNVPVFSPAGPFQFAHSNMDGRTSPRKIRKASRRIVKIRK